jgi:quercetin dioxygenase-like cupin family protein
MALHHAAPGEIVDLFRVPDPMPEDQSIALFKRAEVEVIRRVLDGGQSVPQHRVDGPIVFQCLSGAVTLVLPLARPELTAGHLLYIAPGEPYALEAQQDSVLLMTIVRRAD